MTSMVERVARAIEQAARKSVPWPSVEIEEPEDNWRPQTLEDFVNRTYLGESGAKEVFRAAADAAARAAIEAMRYVDGIDEQAAIDVSVKVGAIDAVTVIECYDGMLTAALNEGADRG